jgi:CRP/FNR family transcriptional regulator, cyclic AMP receptor protein
VLCEGRAKVSIVSDEGKTLVLQIAQAGDLLGLNATLTGQPYGTTAETLERCRIDFIAREPFSKLLDQDKRACLYVAQALARNLSGVVEHARLLLLSRSTSEKVARFLIRLCDQHGIRTPQGIQINCGITQEEMAQMICASRETVNRALSEFKRRHIVSLIDNGIFVHNRKALEAAAGCCQQSDKRCRASNEPSNEWSGY